MAGIGSLANALANAQDFVRAFGPGPDPVKLGPITFAALEVLDELPIGGFEADLVVNKRIGGGRHVADMGVQPSPVTFGGELMQPYIDARISQLTALQLSRQEVLLSWRTHRYYCRVRSFKPGHRHANRCKYTITVEITRAANGAIVPTAPTSIDSQISTIAGNAAGHSKAIATADPTGSSSVLQQVNSALTAIAKAGPIAQLLAPQLSTLVQTVTTASQAVSSYQSTVAQTAPQYVAVTQLTTALTLIAQYAKNGQSVQTVRVQGASMYMIAALYYDDITLAPQLTAANGRVSPYTSRKAPSDIGLPPLQSIKQV